MINAWKYFAIIISTAAIVGIGWFGLKAYKNQIANERNSVVYEKQAAIAKNESCKKREVDYEKQIKNIETDAYNQLKIGTKKADVAKFFSVHRIPFDFFESEAHGTLSTSGCAPIGCGTDSALIGVSVKLSQAGTVTEEPKVVALYTDCL
jgi:hypothetical protein